MSRILIIDDDPAVRQATQLLLECEGFEVVATGDGRTGVTIACAHPFDAVIVDIFMPEMDGLETIKALRASNPRLQIIAVSGALIGGPTGAPDFLNMATKLWNIKTLHKPFRPSDLMRTIREAVAENPALHAPSGAKGTQRGALA
jgi:CheY-like chemotaxis protein